MLPDPTSRQTRSPQGFLRGPFQILPVAIGLLCFLRPVGLGRPRSRGLPNPHSRVWVGSVL
eukprot:10647091-Heterocapsa_arctica.AAC.1